MGRMERKLLSLPLDSALTKPPPSWRTSPILSKCVCVCVRERERERERERDAGVQGVSEIL